MDDQVQVACQTCLDKGEQAEVKAPKDIKISINRAGISNSMLVAGAQEEATSVGEEMRVDRAADTQCRCPTCPAGQKEHSKKWILQTSLPWAHSQQLLRKLARIRWFIKPRSLREKLLTLMMALEMTTQQEQLLCRRAKCPAQKNRRTARHRPLKCPSSRTLSK